MTKRFLIISLLVSLTWLTPIVVSAAPEYMACVLELSVEPEPNVVYTDGYLYVTGGEGYTLEIVSLTGKKVMDMKIESPSQKIELNIPKGCYIVKVGKVVRKVSIR